jgi:hypothetical protein
MRGGGRRPGEQAERGDEAGGGAPRRAPPITPAGAPGQP